MQFRLMRLFLAVSCACLAAACDRSPEPPRLPIGVSTLVPAKDEKQAQHERLVEECRVNVSTNLATYHRLIAQSRYWEASTSIRQCANALDDKALAALVNKAELLSTWQDIKNPKAAPGDRLRQIEALRRDWPEEAKVQEALLARLDSELSRREKAEAAAFKRKSGVSIGMTSEEVLASSWGKPEKVNRTTTASGTREQWVYGGQNYLYFEDGVLTAVQH